MRFGNGKERLRCQGLLNFTFLEDGALFKSSVNCIAKIQDFTQKLRFGGGRFIDNKHMKKTAKARRDNRIIQRNVDWLRLKIRYLKKRVFRLLGSKEYKDSFLVR